MRIGINPFHFTKAAVYEEPRTQKECIDLVKAAGFSVLDAVTQDTPTAYMLSDYIQEQGLEVIQSHIPFNRYSKLDYDQFALSVMKTAKNAKLLGSRILVVHGDEFDFSSQTYSPEAALEFNYRLFSPLVEYAVENGMKVAFENVFQDMDPIKKPRFCSIVEDLCKLTDQYSTDNVGICWDTGHAKVQYGEAWIDALKTAGHRVIATHIHDNYYKKDLHCFPFMGDLDWKTFAAVLRQIEYQGDFTFELVYDRLPKSLAVDYLSLLRRSGEYILTL